jgi:sphingomyelin phosphodiesterase 2
LYRQPHKYYSNAKSAVIRAKHAQVVLTDRVPGHDFSFSDHFGLEVTLEISAPSEIAQTTTSLSLPDYSSTLVPELITTTIQALTLAYRNSHRRSRRELAIFTLSIVLLLGLVISSAWLTQHWINGLFVLFAVFISWLATTHLYAGFLYGNWERNALMNVIEELEIYKKVGGNERSGQISAE